MKKLELDKNLIIKLHCEDKLSILAIAQKYNVHCCVIRRTLKENNIEIKKYRKDISGNKNPNFKTGKYYYKSYCKYCGKKVWYGNNKCVACVSKYENHQLGLKRTEETKTKMKQIWQERLEQWKKEGWIPKIYRGKNSVESKEYIKKVLKRDDYTCQICSHRGGSNLDIHHIKKISEYPELAYDLNNGITLCKSCHRKTFKREKEFEYLFIDLIKTRRN